MSDQTANPDTSLRFLYSSRNLWAGVLFGIGLMAFIDEIIFHQLLHWHHFYDRATTDIGLVSDGILSAFSLAATVGGLFLYADLRRRNAWWPVKWTGGILVGAGGFQLYDGIIDHKVLRVHQVRYNVESLLPYDLAWNIAGAAILITGIVLLIRSRKQAGEITTSSDPK